MKYIGIDVGSVSTDIVVIDEDGRIEEKVYLKTEGNPLKAAKNALQAIEGKIEAEETGGLGVTGSGRALVGRLTGADIVKNEITAHALAAWEYDHSIRTVIEIGGQDSKLILMEDGLVTDFSMNTACAAGTGSFLDRQAERMGMTVEKLGELACRGRDPVKIAARCAVFAESDIIHKQNAGSLPENIAAGMCRALADSYMNNVVSGRKLQDKICFQGGVAANRGMVHAFEDILNREICVPEHHKVMGAIGAALLAKEKVAGGNTSFRGFDISYRDTSVREFMCKGCSCGCEITSLSVDGCVQGYFNDRCGKYQEML